MAKKKVSTARTIYQLKVTLCDMESPVWRRILIHGGTHLDDLHLIIQAAMGWQNCHLHCFTINDQAYGEPDPDFDELAIMNESYFTLNQLIRRANRLFTYEYDFGDGWTHHIKVEKIVAPEDGVTYPVCTDGERACPPEDVGGVWGYQDCLEAIADPKHKEHQGFLEWVGSEFDPEKFDLDRANADLKDYRLLDSFEL